MHSIIPEEKRKGAPVLAHAYTHDAEESQKRYHDLVKARRPSKPIVRNALAAFAVGGFICLAGQGIMWFFMTQGMSAKQAGGPTSVVLIGIGALLTGLGWYDTVTKLGGMGGSLPITGFANSIVAPAMEFRQEGPVLGVGARLFTVAGPVLAYGMGTAFLMGLIRYLWGAL